MTRVPVVAVALLATAFLFPTSSLGAQIAVDVVGTGSDEAPPVTDGDCTLREAVTAASANAQVDACPPGDIAVEDSIMIPNGVVELTGAAGDDINQSGDVDVGAGGPLEIIGAGRDETFVQATGSDRAFDLVVGESVALSDMEIYGGGPTGEGGALRAGAFVHADIERSDVHSNTAKGANGRGGAIYGPENSNISIAESTITANTAEFSNGSATHAASGGGIYSAGDLLIDKTTVSGNHATGLNIASRGGGIAALGPRASIVRSTILANDTASASGGGISFGRGLLTTSHTVSRTTVENNTSPLAGGGIDVLGPTSLQVFDSTIRDNHVTGDHTGTALGAAGINSAPNNDTDRLTITRSSVIENDVSASNTGGGAAIRMTRGELGIHDSAVAHNTLSSPNTALGGAIRVLNAAVTIENSTVFGNDLLTDVENSTGGALALASMQSEPSPDGTARIVHSTFAGNTVTGQGSEVYADDTGSVELRGAILEGDCQSSASGQAISADSRRNVLGSTTCDQGSGNQTVSANDLGLAATEADNGGPTATVRLLPGSPALNLVPPAACDRANGRPLRADQRGARRPVGSGCDAGAYELTKCRGVIVGIVVQSVGDHRVVGTPGPDGILGRGSSDVLRGVGGDDALCGRGGKDRLNGGNGSDQCDGGSGRDTATGGCERKHSIP